MSEIITGFEALTSGGDVPSLVREGLPSSYRMRADAHYVDQLDSGPVSSPIRLVDPKTIEVRGEEPTPSSHFIDSIRQHGVLQPLLVHGRSDRYRLIAGRKRLMAALAAGLRDVPCIVQRVDDDQVATLAAATNIPAQPTPPSIHRTAAASWAVEAATGELMQSLTALASSANLLAGASGLTHVVAIDLVRAEAARALQLVLASRVIGQQVAMTRSRVSVRQVAERAAQATAAERRLRNIDLTISMDGQRQVMVRGDEELLANAVAGLVMATITLMPAGGARTLAIDVSTLPDARVSLGVTQDTIVVPESWLAGAFDAAWPIGAGATSALVFLQAAQRIGQLHGGDVHASSTATGTMLSLGLPTLIREM